MAGDSPRTEPYRHVACCVDDSDAAAVAVTEAARAAGMVGARLSLVHALPAVGRFTGGWTVRNPSRADLADDLRDEARGWLGALAEAHPGAAPVILDAGEHPADAVAAWASEAGCDLLVCAPWRGPVARMAHLGSFANRLVRRAPCPVMLVGAAARR
jgi:nucleotide-binding universal stress UspA family protein